MEIIEFDMTKLNMHLHVKPKSSPKSSCLPHTEPPEEGSVEWYMEGWQKCESCKTALVGGSCSRRSGTQQTKTYSIVV